MDPINGEKVDAAFAAEAKIHIRDGYSTFNWIMEGFLNKAVFRRQTIWMDLGPRIYAPKQGTELQFWQFPLVIACLRKNMKIQQMAVCLSAADIKIFRHYSSWPHTKHTKPSIPLCDKNAISLFKNACFFHGIHAASDRCNRVEGAAGCIH